MASNSALYSSHRHQLFWCGEKCVAWSTLKLLLFVLSFTESFLLPEIIADWIKLFLTGSDDRI